MVYKKIFFVGLVLGYCGLFGADTDKDNKKNSGSSIPEPFNSLRVRPTNTSRNYREEIVTKKSDKALENPLIQQATTSGPNKYTVANFPELPFSHPLTAFDSPACAFAQADTQYQLNSAFQQINGIRTDVAELKKNNNTNALTTASTSAVTTPSSTRARAKSGIPSYDTRVVRINVTKPIDSSTAHQTSTSPCPQCKACGCIYKQDQRIQELEKKLGEILTKVASLEKQEKKAT